MGHKKTNKNRYVRKLNSKETKSKLCLKESKNEIQILSRDCVTSSGGDFDVLFVVSVDWIV